MKKTTSNWLYAACILSIIFLGGSIQRVCGGQVGGASDGSDGCGNGTGGGGGTGSGGSGNGGSAGAGSSGPTCGTCGGGRGGNSGNGSTGGNGSSCSNCPSGMTMWEVSEPYINLWLYDEPLGYQPGLGPRISFKLSYKQRDARFLYTAFQEITPASAPNGTVRG